MMQNNSDISVKASIKIFLDPSPPPHSPPPKKKNLKKSPPQKN